MSHQVTRFRRRKKFERSQRGREAALPFRKEYWPDGLNSGVRRFARSTKPAIARGALILLALKHGATYTQAAEDTSTALNARAKKQRASDSAPIVKISVTTVRTWRRRFLEAMAAHPHDMTRVLERLWPKPDSDRRELMAKARRLLHLKGATTRDVAREVGLSQSTVARLNKP